MSTTSVRRPAAVRRAGLVCLVSGVLGAVSGVLLALVEPAVAADRWSYPLGAGAYIAVQIWFGVQHLGLVLGLLALHGSGALGTGRAGRIGLVGAVGGMLGLTLTEFAAVAAAGDGLDTALVGALGAAYGVCTLVIGVALVVVGVAVLRAGMWRGPRRWLPLALGLWVFVPMLPALAVDSFVGGRLAIAGWMLLFAVLGWVLLRDEPRAPSVPGAPRPEPGRVR